MKVTLNLANRRNAVHQMAVLLAKPLLPLLAVGFLCLVLVQILEWHHRQDLEEQLTNLAAAVGAQKVPPLRKLSANDYKRQAAAVALVDGLAARDNFSWIALLGRLETTLTKGVTLTQIAPNYGQRSLQLNGLAEDVDALQDYLNSLLRSDTLAAAYLLQQENREIKDRSGRKNRAVSFRIEIQKAF